MNNETNGKIDDEILDELALIDIAARALAQDAITALPEGTNDKIVDFILGAGTDTLTDMFRDAATLIVKVVQVAVNLLTSDGLIIVASRALYEGMQSNTFNHLNYTDDQLRESADHGARIAVTAILESINA